jgi:sugar phosphate isomerase/epimerase
MSPSGDPRARLSLNQATTRKQWTLREAIEGCSRHGLRALSVWPDKLAECGIGEARRLLADHGMAVASFCLGGLFPAGHDRFDDHRRMLDSAAAIGARCIVAVVGTLDPAAKDLAAARRRIEDGLRSLLPHARALGVPLALEPIHPMRAGDLCCVNTLAQANDLCDALGDGLGIVVDVHHVWWDPGLERELARAGGRIRVFQLCDWLRDTAALRDDRGMMGDGVIDLPLIRRWVDAAGYDGFYDVEIMSERTWWQRDADEVVDTCIERFRTAC